MERSRRRLVVGSSVAVLGLLVLSVALYFLALNHKTPRCSGPPHVVCVLDENSGSIESFFGIAALVGVAISLAGIWIAVRTLRRESVDFHTLLLESAYEAVHNLHHLAESHAAGWSAWPSLSTRTGSRLLAPGNIASVAQVGGQWHPGRPLWAHLDHLIRNEDYLAPARFRNPAPLEPEQKVLGYLTEHCARFVIDAARSDQACADMLAGAEAGPILLLTRPSSAFYRDAYWIRMSVEEAIVDLGKGREVAEATTVIVAWTKPPGVTHSELLGRIRSIRPRIRELVFIGESFKNMPDPPRRQTDARNAWAEAPADRPSWPLMPSPRMP